MQQHRREPTKFPGEGAGRLPHQAGRPRVLNIIWRRVERCWERAEVASRAVEKQRQQGISVRGKTYPEQVAWKKASRAFNLYEKKETVWKRAERALEVFRPDGQLNDRAWAQEQVAWALPRLGSEWSKVRRLLQKKESFTFLDRLHDQLGQLSLPETLRDRWCTYGGCGGNGRGNRARRQSEVMAMSPPLCSRFSAKNWTRTGGSRTGRSRRC